MRAIHLRLLSFLALIAFSPLTFATNNFSLATGGSHACALTGTGGVKCWGKNDVGQLGDGTNNDSLLAKHVIGLAGEAISITTGPNHSCALIKNGAVQCWGRNQNGELGNGTKNNSNTPTTVATVPGFTQTAKAVEAGGHHTCALLTNGEVWCWGGSLFGELADSSVGTDTPWPTKALGVASAALAVTAGDGQTCALLDSRKLQCWGLNASGQLGNPLAGVATDTPFFVQDGNGVDLANIKRVVAGGNHTCALDMSGQVWCWGANATGQIGNGQSGAGSEQTTAVPIVTAGSIVEITASNSHTCARESNGHLQCWGENLKGQLGNGSATLSQPLPTPSAQHDFSAVSAGLQFTCGRQFTGIILCWGSNSSGQLGDNSRNSSLIGVEVVQTTSSNYQQVAAGAYHTCAVTQSGGVYCWGGNYSGQLGNGSTTSSSLAVPVQGLSSGVKQVAAGSYHSCAVMMAGGVKCWGADFVLGNGATTDSPVPVDVLSASSGSPITGIQAISANELHTCALTHAGTVKCWGSLPDLGSKETAVDIPGLTDITAIDVGGDHTCALTSAGMVKCWGENWGGQLGNDTTTYSATPVEVYSAAGDATPLSGITAVAAGYGSTCALTATKKVKCWGYNAQGQLGDNTTTDRLAPVDVVADQNGGLLSNITAIVADTIHVCALTESATAKCWGWNGVGALGNGQMTHSNPFPVDVLDGSGAPLSNLLNIATGGSHSCAVKIDGKILCWGDGSVGQLGDNITLVSPIFQTVPNFNQALSVTAGDNHNCALSTQNAAISRVWCWGTMGAISTGNHHFTIFSERSPTLKNTAAQVSKVVSGTDHVCALIDNTVQCWGNNYFGQLGDGTRESSSNWRYVKENGVDLTGITDIAAGRYHTCGITTTAEVKCWGWNVVLKQMNLPEFVTSPIKIPGLTNVTAIAARYLHTCVLTSGVVKCWGNNYLGQLGDGTNVAKSTPVAVSGLSGLIVTSLTAGDSHTCATTNTGAVKCWGQNDKGQLGDGTTQNRATPVSVTGLNSGIVQIAASGNHTCALTTTGTVKCWGYNLYGQLGDDTTTQRLTPTDVLGLSGVISVATGESHTCAGTNDERIRCWGSNYQGQLGDGNTGNQTVPSPISEPFVYDIIFQSPFEESF